MVHNARRAITRGIVGSLVTLFTLLTLGLFTAPAAHALTSNKYDFPNSRIADRALLHPNGEKVGQCLRFVEDMVQEAGGGIVPYLAAGSYPSKYQDFWKQHAVLIGGTGSQSKALKGDIVQFGGGDGVEGKIHTLIITEPGKDPMIIDSNWKPAGDGRVDRARFSTRTSAGNYRIWRVGRVTPAPTQPAPAPAPAPTPVLRDFTGDGRPDFFAVDPTNGNLNRFGERGQFQATADSGFLGARQVISGGDYNGDRRPDVVVWTDTDDQVKVYLGNGDGTLRQDSAGTISLGTGWNANVNLIAGGADYDGDAKPDLMAIWKDGSLRLYSNKDGTGRFTAAAAVVSYGWGGVTYLVGGGDYNGDGRSDLYAEQNGSLYLEPGNGAGGIGSPIPMGSGWAGVTLIGGADFSGDGNLDLVGIHPPTDTLYLYKNDGRGTVGVTAEPLGRGWAYYQGADGRLAAG
jgi:hypothetical protein